MAEEAIVADQLSYAYGDLLAVDNISFKVKPGEIVGFLGPNGAGKTTTVKMLTGQLKPKKGKALLLGLDVAKEPQRVQSEIGVCFEETNLYEQMNAVENLVLFARLFGVKDFDPLALLERVGLAGREKQRVEGFSKGMKQRLMVARSLINQPKILFLDEPTEGLDPNSSERIRHVILEERERGATVFLTTHDMLEADKMSDRVAFIDQGKIVAFDAPLNLKQRYGQRALALQISSSDGGLEQREIALDQPDTADDLRDIFSSQQVVTVHSKEASLEDIFIDITGKKLV